MYLGQLSMPLSDLLRGRREQAVSAKEYTLIFEAQHYANIQIVLINEAEQCSREMNINRKTKQTEKKNRTVSNHPIVIPSSDMMKVQQTFVQERITSAVSGDSRL
jgi:hypothetical protein